MNEHKNITEHGQPSLDKIMLYLLKNHVKDGLVSWQQGQFGFVVQVKIKQITENGEVVFPKRRKKNDE